MIPSQPLLPQPTWALDNDTVKIIHPALGTEMRAQEHRVSGIRAPGELRQTPRPEHWGLQIPTQSVARIRYRAIAFE